ncbi:MAG TPA: flavodoxin family protein [Methanocellales archaeon]|nr:flavodoxin family protein [Methanocellales archaeon]
MKVNVLGICGSPVKGGNVEKLLEITLDVAREEKDVEVQEMVKLAGTKIQDCNQCNWCLTKQEEGKFCNKNDDMMPIYPKIMAADVILIATPTYISRSATYAEALIGRLRCIGEGMYYRFRPEARLCDKVGGALTVAYMRHAGVETALLSIIQSFIMFNLVVASGGPLSVYGVGAVSSKGGAGGCDMTDRHPAIHDDVAIRSAEFIAKRAVCLAKIIKAGKQALPMDEWSTWLKVLDREMDNNLAFQLKRKST